MLLQRQQQSLQQKRRRGRRRGAEPDETRRATGSPSRKELLAAETVFWGERKSAPGGSERNE